MVKLDRAGTEWRPLSKPAVVGVHQAAACDPQKQSFRMQTETQGRVQQNVKLLEQYRKVGWIPSIISKSSNHTGYSPFTG